MILIELRRGIAAPVAFLVGVVVLVIASSEQSTNVVLWTELSRGLLYSLVVAGPVAAAAGAWAGGRDADHEASRFFGMARRYALHRHLAAGGVVAAAAVSGFGVAGLGLVVRTGQAATWGNLDLALVMVAPCALIAYTAVGYMLGRLGPRWLVPPLVGLGVYFGQYLAAIRPGPSALFGLVPLVGFDVFHRRAGGVPIVLAAWLAAVFAASLTTLYAQVGESRRLRGWASLAGVVAVVLGAVLVSSGQGWLSSDEVAFTPECESEVGLQVCVHPAFRAVDDEIRRVVATTLGPLRGVAGSPRAAVQSLVGGARMLPDGVVEFGVPRVSGRYEPALVASSVAVAAVQGPCAERSAMVDPTDLPEAVASQHLVAAWLVDPSMRDPAALATAPVTEIDRARQLTAVPPQVMRRWLAENLLRLRSCSIDLEDLPR